MDKVYDIAVIGAGSNGSYVAERMAAHGYSVKVIEKCPREEVGTKYDIFHLGAPEFEKFHLPRPVEGDPSWAFEFHHTDMGDPYGDYRVVTKHDVVGLHMQEYTQLLNDHAVEQGAELEYGATFLELLMEGESVAGLKYRAADGTEQTVRARVVADCSGFQAVARTSLKGNAFMEDFSLQGNDMFYVVLRYIKLLDSKDYLTGSCSWPFYKSWIAPCADPHGAILGIGACNGFDACEENFQKMEQTLKLPRYELDHIERGVTPYTRPPYSLVTDGFFAGGDAACLTKALNGEGVTSGMVGCKIALEAIDAWLKEHPTSEDSSPIPVEALWTVTAEYNRQQGAGFSFMRALLTSVVKVATIDEFRYIFEHGILTDELWQAVTDGTAIPKEQKDAALAKVRKGIFRRKLSGRTLKGVMTGLQNATAIRKHYLALPPTPDKVAWESWCRTADALWTRIGKMQ